MGDLGEREMMGADRGVDSVGEEEGGSAGGSQVEVGGQSGECAVRARVVVKDRHSMPEFRLRHRRKTNANSIT